MSNGKPRPATPAPKDRKDNGARSGNAFDGLSDALTGPAEILVEGSHIMKVARSVGRPAGAQVIDLSERTVSPGLIDTHVHLTMDAANLALQTLQSAAAKAFKGLSLAPIAEPLSSHPQLLIRNRWPMRNSSPSKRGLSGSCLR